MTIFLAEIQIGFENAELVAIPAKSILTADVHGIKNFRRSFSCFDDEKGAPRIEIFKGLEAERILLIIRSVDGVSIRTTYDNDLFNRIVRRSDITSLTFKYSDGTEELIYTDWQGTDETNFLQTVYLDCEGNLTINIGQKKHALKVFVPSNIK